MNTIFGRWIFTLACALAMLWIPACNAADLAYRKSISILAKGVEVASIAMDGNQAVEFAATTMTRDDKDGSIRLAGNVVVTLVEAGHAKLTFTSDGAILRKRPLSAAEDAAIHDLEAMRSSDQSYRGSGQMFSTVQQDAQGAIDAANLRRLEEIIARYGWPGFRFAGGVGAKAAAYVLQHAPDVDVQARYLPLVERAVQDGDASASDLAMLQDRILVRSGKPQRYGTQLATVSPPTLEPTDDPERLDARRARMGLPPVAEYLASFASH